MKKFQLRLIYIVTLLILCVTLTSCSTIHKVLKDTRDSGNENNSKVSLNTMTNQNSDSSKANPPIPSSVSSKTDDCEPSEKLIKLLQKAALTTNDLKKANCQQLITVTGNGNIAEICFFELKNNIWQEAESTGCQGHLGKNGINKNKIEGDNCTPFGLYSIGSAFYIEQKPATGLNCFKITDESYWVDDPNSKFYNQYVIGEYEKDWKSAEHMIDYSGYKYGFTINYNTEQTKGAGSAIFFHIGKSYTAGCVATYEENVLKYLSLLDSDKNPHILLQ